MRRTRKSGRNYHRLGILGLAVAAAVLVGLLARSGLMQGNLTLDVGAAAGLLTGRANVADGDTVEIAGTRIRFNGIDAPEMNQTCVKGDGRRYRCGVEAAMALDEFLSRSRPMRCEFVEWDRYRRFVGNCYRADGANVAQWLVRNGHAVDWPRYSGGWYASAQTSARNEKLGLWQGSFDLPWNWREGERQRRETRSAPRQRSPNTVPSSASQSDRRCRIKGNISRRTGARIYHVPGQNDYENTRISEQHGERWFCSESEARAAGWRRAGK